MTKHRCLLLAALILAVVSTGPTSICAREARTAGRYLVDSWQTDQGLPQNSVISIVQSRDGYLWLATFNGLVRFDGVRFTVFNSHNTPALDSSRIVRVWEDGSGCLWIGSESLGLARRNKGVFERMMIPDRPAQLNFICDGAKPGEVWLTLTDGRLLHFAGGRFQEKKVTWNQRNLFAITPLQFDDKRLFVWTDMGMFVLKEDKFVPAIPDKAPGPNNSNVMGPSRNGWWSVLDGKIARAGPDGSLAIYPIANWLTAGIAILYEDKRGNLWIGTLGAGVAKIDANGRRQIIRDELGLGHAQVRAFLEDHEGNIWIGTDGAGLYRLRIGAFSVIDKVAGLGADIALAVAETEDGLWIGTNGGGLTQVTEDRIRTYSAPEGLDNVHIWTLLEDRKKTLWVGTWGAGVYKKVGERFEQVPELNVLGGIVPASYQAPSGTLWFGGPGGLVSYASGVRHFTRADGLSHDDVRAITDDGDGGLWIGSNGGGVNHFKHGKFTAIRREQGLADDSVWALYRDANNALWIGTFGGGLSVLREGSVITYTTEDGLPSGVICSITEDQSGNLWMSSYNGVFRVNKAKLLERPPGSKEKPDIFVFNKSDGLPSRECTGSFQPAFCRNRDGQFIFPTVKGVAIVDPMGLPFNPRPPRVTIEEAEIDGLAVPFDSPSSTLSIPPNSAQIQFRYTGLSFSAPEKVRFRYKLEGLDKDWQDAGSRRTAYYSHLPPGEYHFHVTAANNDGVWNKSGSVLAVRVIPAFWQTWWFLSVCVLLGGGAFAGAVRYVEVSRLQRRMQLLEQQHAVERERARIAKDIHDDLGASLTQITLLSELARTDLVRPPEAEAHIRQISGTARELTRAMDEIVWAVNPQNDTLEDLLTYTVKFAQEHLGIARIRCRLDVPAHLPPLHLSAEIRHNLFLAIKEAINNVAKHSKANEAWLRLRSSEKSFEFEIEDNGCGVPDAAIAGRVQDLASPGSHNGLRNMERRLREIDGTFEIMPRSGGGTLVRMRVEAPTQ